MRNCYQETGLHDCKVGTFFIMKVLRYLGSKLRFKSVLSKFSECKQT